MRETYHSDHTLKELEWEPKDYLLAMTPILITINYIATLMYVYWSIHG
jgi:hypothetical protein